MIFKSSALLDYVVLNKNIIYDSNKNMKFINLSLFLFF